MEIKKIARRTRKAAKDNSNTLWRGFMTTCMGLFIYFGNSFLDRAQISEKNQEVTQVRDSTWKQENRLYRAASLRKMDSILTALYHKENDNN